MIQGTASIVKKVTKGKGAVTNSLEIDEEISSESRDRNGRNMYYDKAGRSNSGAVITVETTNSPR